MNSTIQFVEPNQYFDKVDGGDTLSDLDLLCALAEKKKKNKQKYMDAVSNIRNLYTDGILYHAQCCATLDSNLN